LWFQAVRWIACVASGYSLNARMKMHPLKSAPLRQRIVELEAALAAKRS
jgi:hypothetical protein